MSGNNTTTRHSSFILLLFLVVRFAEVVLFCIPNSLVSMSCTSLEALAPKSQKKNLGGWGKDASVSPSDTLNQTSFLFCLHLYFTICETNLPVCIWPLSRISYYIFPQTKQHSKALVNQRWQPDALEFVSDYTFKYKLKCRHLCIANTHLL